MGAIIGGLTYHYFIAGPPIAAIPEAIETANAPYPPMGSGTAHQRWIIKDIGPSSFQTMNRII